MTMMSRLLFSRMTRVFKYEDKLKIQMIVIKKRK